MNLSDARHYHAHQKDPPPPYTELPQHHLQTSQPQRCAPGPIDTQQQYLPVDFVVDDLPSPASLAPEPEQAIRRIKSSSALSGSASAPTSASIFTPTTANDTDVSSPSGQATTDLASRWKSAVGDAQYFAGGLISRPAESTRHYSIIRHSHALVWYRGPSTSVSITILSDDPLPASRSVWLQQKGYSGNMGMSLKALVGTTSGWLDVTPARRAGTEHISEPDERGIQRDFRRFVKKASGRQKKHAPRETHIIRIPAAATDGYFRLVLCAGDGGEDSKDGSSTIINPKKLKVLCGSPVFRIASTSTDSASLRGASLGTMPLEVGVKVASTIGQTVAAKYTGVAGALVQSRAGKVVTSSAAKKFGQKALQGYRAAGVGDVVGESWKRSRENRSYDPLVGQDEVGNVGDGGVRALGSDNGPEEPFPVKFEGKVVRGTGKSTTELGIPTANLSGVPEMIKLRMGGVFAAWVRVVVVQPSSHSQHIGDGDDDISPDWHEAIVTIAPLRNAAPSIAMKNRVTVHIIHDFDISSSSSTTTTSSPLLLNTTLKVLLMAYIRPSPLPSDDIHPDDTRTQHTHDIFTTLASLGTHRGPAWAAPAATIAQIKATRGERTLTERLDGASGKVAERVDRMPLHWAGVRSEAGAARDKVYGNGGMWIPR